MIQGLCEKLRPGSTVDARTLETRADDFLASNRVVPLIREPADAESSVRFRRRDGRLMPALREEIVYSTPELLPLEQRVVEHAVDSKEAGAGVASPAAVRAAEAARPTLSDEQRTMVRRLCRDGDGVAVVVGKAGAGKTFALDAAREAWQAAGIPVVGVAVARRVAHDSSPAPGSRARASPRCSQT